MHRSTTVTSGPRSSSWVTGHGSGEGGPDRRLVEAELAEAHALGVGVHADAVQRRHAVGRRCTRTRLCASSTSTPSPTRGTASVSASSLREGELARGDHPGEAVEDVDVGALELAGLPAERRRRLLGQHGDRARRRSAPGCRAPAPAPAAARPSSSPSMSSPCRRRGRRSRLLGRAGRCRPSRCGRRSGEVVGRIWARTTNSPAARPLAASGAKSSRSAKQRSASRPQRRPGAGGGRCVGRRDRCGSGRARRGRPWGLDPTRAGSRRYGVGIVFSAANSASA